MPTAKPRDPRTKEELLNRMFSIDFNGDIRTLGVRPGTLERISRNAARIHFPDSGITFELVIRRPREFAKTSKTAQKVGEAGDGHEETATARTARPVAAKPKGRTAAARKRA